MTITKNVSNYNDVSLANKSSLGILPEALFFMPIWARCTENYKLTRDLSPLSARE